MQSLLRPNFFFFKGVVNPEISGVVLDVRSASITVAFEDESVYEHLCESNQMALVKLANDITHRLIFLYAKVSN